MSKPAGWSTPVLSSILLITALVASLLEPIPVRADTSPATPVGQPADPVPPAAPVLPAAPLPPAASVTPAASAATVAPGTSAVPHSPTDPVRIGLGLSLITAAISAPAEIKVVADGVVQATVSAAQGIRIDLVEGRIQVGNLPLRFAGPVRLVPIEPEITIPGIMAKPVNPITYNQKSYRGEIEVVVTRSEGRLSLINVINMEQYLLGVLPKEMPSGWPVEALKAQAVAARTYAWRNMKKYAAEGFDLIDTTDSQVYGGLLAEQPSTIGAVVVTAGQVLTYSGQLAATFYHASSGGHTENNEIVWNGAPIAYLRGVPDFDNLPNNRNFAWRYLFTPEQVTAALAKNNHLIGSLSSIKTAGPVGASGRPSRWSISGPTTSLTLTAEQLRWTLGLPSSAQSVIVRLAAVANLTRFFRPTDTLNILGADGQISQRAVSNSHLLGASTPVRLAAAGITAWGQQVMQESGVEVLGGGWGHAVGMSQWGAYGMALSGKSYTEILGHYYRGSVLETRPS